MRVCICIISVHAAFLENKCGIFSALVTKGGSILPGKINGDMKRSLSIILNPKYIGFISFSLHI
jgi:hypothetical protein